MISSGVRTSSRMSALSARCFFQILMFSIVSRKFSQTEQVQLADHVWADKPYIGPVQVQISAHGNQAAGSLTANGNVQWVDAHRKVAPGQAVVFYIDDLVIGGATAI